MLTEHIQLSDLVITTAAIPGKPLPKLIGTAQVAGMKAYEAPCKASPYVRASIAQLIIAADGRVASDIELAPLAIINTIFDRFYHAGARSPTWPDIDPRSRVGISRFHVKGADTHYPPLALGAIDRRAAPGAGTRRCRLVQESVC